MICAGCPPLWENSVRRYFVAAHQFLNGPAHRFRVVLSLEVDDIAHVVDRAARGEMIQEPELFLREGKRSGSGRLAALDPLNIARRTLGRGDDLATSRDRGILEQGLERNVHAEHVPNARHRTDGQQGMAAQIEEIVVDSDVVDLQQFGPNQRQGFLRLGLRPDEFADRLHIFMGGPRKRLAIDLAVRRQRKFFHQHKLRRDHVLRQPVFQEFAQARGRQDFFVHGRKDADMPFGGLLPQEAVRRRWPNGVHVAQFGFSQQRVLLDQNLIALLFQQRGNGLEVSLLIHFDHQLANLGPVLGADSLQHVPLTFFNIDFQQIDAFQALFRDHAG